MDQESSLLDSPSIFIGDQASLNACFNSHGLYHPLQFVLRLSPPIHRLVDSLPKGRLTEGSSTEQLQAYSTYLHETIHWWQHIGSTAGFLLSLSYPAQTHMNFPHLKKLVEFIGPKKSLMQFLKSSDPTGLSTLDTAIGRANHAVNNYLDIEFFRSLLMGHHSVQEIYTHPVFEGIAHTYNIAYSGMLNIISETVDPGFDVLPNPDAWGREFKELEFSEVEGFYRSSRILVPPVNVREIFEGQARFCQIQYLYFATGKHLDWDYFRGQGMLAGEYVTAFEFFLRVIKSEWPRDIDDPVVALFLLICDISINPGEGFPLPLKFPRSFINDVTPGLKFTQLCWVVANKRPDLVLAITNYSSEEYVDVCAALCVPLMTYSPLQVAGRVVSWYQKLDGVKDLMVEKRKFEFRPENLPVRFLLSHFIQFCADKLLRPEFFCWPGAWMAGLRASEDILPIFDRHSAPFMDKEDDHGVFARQVAGKSDSVVHNTFNQFYSGIVVYDLTRQWIAQPGPFNYNYNWLSSGERDAIQDFASRSFELSYSVHPNEFAIY